MPLHWLCYRHNNQISVVIEPGASPIHARMHAALAGTEKALLSKVMSLTGDGKSDDRTPVVAGGSEEVVGQVRVT